MPKLDQFFGTLKLFVCFCAGDSVRVSLSGRDPTPTVLRWCGRILPPSAVQTSPWWAPELVGVRVAVFIWSIVVYDTLWSFAGLFYVKCGKQAWRKMITCSINLSKMTSQLNYGRSYLKIEYLSVKKQLLSLSFGTSRCAWCSCFLTQQCPLVSGSS